MTGMLVAFGILLFVAIVGGKISDDVSFIRGLLEGKKEAGK